MSTTFLGIIYFVAFSHAAMLSVVLWRRSLPGGAGKLLAIVIGILAYKLFEGGAQHSGLYRHVPHLMGLIPYMVMLVGPVFWGYVQQVTGVGAIAPMQWILHLAPWAGMWFHFNSGLVFRSVEQKIAMYDQWHMTTDEPSRQLPVFTVAILLAIKLHLSSYLFASWKGLGLFAKSVDNLRSDNSSALITQLRSLLIVFIALEALWVGLFLAQQYGGVGTLDQIGQLWLLFIALVVLAIGFSGLQRPNLIFSNEERILSQAENTLNKAAGQTDPSQERVRYIHSALPESTTNEISRMIEKVLTEDQLYLDERLSLTDLSKAIGMKPHTISQVINQGMRTSFYKLINGYRVQHAATLLETAGLTWPIERIALESGFSNRVTFNKAFKDHMNCTASAYRKGERQAG